MPCGRRLSCKHALSISCGIHSSTPQRRTGRRSRKTSSRCIPRVESEALDRFAEFSGKWEKRYPAIIRLWETRRPNSCVPAVRPGNKNGYLHHQRDRIDQRPAAAGGQCPRPLPDRAGGSEVPVPGDPEPGPHRQGPPAVDQPVEGRSERLRHHLRRPPERRTEVTPNTPVPRKLTDPLCQESWGLGAGGLRPASRGPGELGRGSRGGRAGGATMCSPAVATAGTALLRGDGAAQERQETGAGRRGAGRMGAGRMGAGRRGGPCGGRAVWGAGRWAGRMGGGAVWGAGRMGGGPYGGRGRGAAGGGRGQGRSAGREPARRGTGPGQGPSRRGRGGGRDEAQVTGSECDTSY